MDVWKGTPTNWNQVLSQICTSARCILNVRVEMVLLQLAWKSSFVHTNCSGHSCSFLKTFKMQYKLHLKNLPQWHFATCKSRVRFWFLTKSAAKLPVAFFIIFLKTWCSLLFLYLHLLEELYSKDGPLSLSEKKYINLNINLNVFPSWLY